MPNFTKGKWHIESDMSIITKDKDSCMKDYIADVCDYFEWDGEAQANARLIAAAPEMYELLRRCALFQPLSSNEIWAILDRIDGKEEA